MGSLFKYTMDTLIDQLLIFLRDYTSIFSSYGLDTWSIFRTWPIIQLLFLLEWMQIVKVFGQSTLSRANYSIILPEWMVERLPLYLDQLYRFFLSARVIECCLTVYRYTFDFIVLSYFGIWTGYLDPGQLFSRLIVTGHDQLSIFFSAWVIVCLTLLVTHCVPLYPLG